MLKNEELKQIIKAHTLLGMIWAYAMTSDENDLYEKTGVTIKDLNDSMNALNHIHTKYSLAKQKASERANAWNKANPNKHKEHNREYIKRKREGR